MTLRAQLFCRPPLPRHRA